MWHLRVEIELYFTLAFFPPKNAQNSVWNQQCFLWQKCKSCSNPRLSQMIKITRSQLLSREKRGIDHTVTDSGLMSTVWPCLTVSKVSRGGGEMDMISHQPPTIHFGIWCYVTTAEHTETMLPAVTISLATMVCQDSCKVEPAVYHRKLWRALGHVHWLSVVQRMWPVKPWLG